MKTIITLVILVAGTLLIMWALPQDNLVSVVEEKNTEAEVETENPKEIDELVLELEGEVTVPEGERNPDREICVGEYCDGSMSGEDNFTVVQIPLITSGGDIGCGNKVFLSPYTVEPKTKAVMDATYEVLFDLKPRSEIEADDIHNIVGTETKLWYDSVTLEDGVATLSLAGKPQNVSHCAAPAFRAQIEEAALQFDTVDTLQVYLNGDLWDWCDYEEADPQESGCDTTPKYWIAS